MSQADAPEPVDPDEFAAAAVPLIGPARFAVAASGGADSTALLHLANEWCRREGRELPLAVTVDHGLRPAATTEAAEVARWSAAAGIEHTTLRWVHDGPTANLQSMARDARYTLIGNWMRARGIGILATGHTSDDQAETVLMRLARGSGLEGLSGMKPHRPFPTGLHPELTIARPLLSLSHDRLIATLRMRNLAWIEDPSNGDARFLRVQVRRMMPQLAQVGMSPSRLAETAAHLSRANNLVSGLAQALEARCVGMQPWGYALLLAEPLRAAHDELACRVLAQTLKTVSGATYPPVFGHVEAALRWIREAEGVAGRTLGGCRLARRADGAILVAREDAAIERGNPVERIRAGQTVLWDGRFSVTMPDSVGPGEFEVKAVGMRGLLNIPDEAGFPPHEPRRVAAVCPGIWQADRLVSAPNLGFHRDFCGTSTFRGLTRA